MSRIDELIARLAPHGVPYKTVGEVADVGTGSSDRKDATSDGEYPFYVRSKNVLAIDSYEFDEEAILIPGEGGIGEIFHFVTGKYALHQRAYRIHFRTAAVDSKFAFYYFSTHFKEFILLKAVSATVISIRKPMITDFRIPVPDIEVQREIVKILDAFTALSESLETELEARRRQYDFLRDELLDFRGDSFEWVTMPSIAKNLDSRRRPVTRGARAAGAIPYYGASGVVDHVSEHIFDGDYLLISEDGANLLARSTPIAFSISGKSWVNNHAHVLEFPSYATRRFVEIYLNSIDLSSYVTGGAQPKLNQANLNSIQIPALQSAHQERIVEIFDSLDALIDDPEGGVIAELEARVKQYDYYRARLLTFDEAAV